MAQLMQNSVNDFSKIQIIIQIILSHNLKENILYTLNYFITGYVQILGAMLSFEINII